MKKIIIDEFLDGRLLDVYLTEDNEIIELEQGITSLESAEKIVNQFINEYQLSDDTEIIDNSFGNDENIEDVEKSTVREWKELGNIYN